MNVVYYKYFIHHNKQRCLVDLLPLLKTFCKIKNEKFRRAFLTPSDDNLFLFHIDSRTFLFVITKNKEVIKTISGNTLSHDDIYNRLQKDESLGFASYIYIGKNYYGIASTFFGPKNSYWTHFLNVIFEKLNIEDYIFDSEPFPVGTSKTEALKFSFKGQTSIKINSSHPYFNQFLGLFGAQAGEAKTIIIEIKPDPNKEMSKTFDSITKAIPLDGIDKFTVRGREFYEDSMTDYYIVGSGHICDNITVKKDSDICKILEEKIAKNRKLKGAVDEFSKDKNFSKTDIPAISRFSDLDSWSNFI